MARPTFITIAGIAVVALLGAGGATYYGYTQLGSAIAKQETFADPYIVRPIDLVVSVSGKGTLEAVDNLDISCPVNGQSTIVSIVDEGVTVTKDQVVVTLDTSEFERQLKTVSLEISKGESDLTWAVEQRAIQESKNASDLETAQVELTLAQLSLKEYDEGVYPQKLKSAQLEAEAAKIAVTRAEKDLSQTRMLQQKGFATTSEIDKSEQDLIEKRNKLTKAESELDVLQKYTHEKELAEKRDKLQQAKNKVERVKSENASQLSQKTADEGAKRHSLELNKNEATRLKDMIAACTIKAPGNGIVIYSTTIMNYRDEGRLAPGSKVYEGRLILRIPDTTRMKVNFSVPEDQVVKLSDYEKTPYPVTFKVAGRSEPLAGQIKKVNTLPEEGSWWSGNDIKKYAVDIGLPETPAGLKPGMSADVTITLRTIPQTLAVPPSGVYSHENDAWVFVLDAVGQPTPRKVKLGESNATHVQIVEGVAEGDRLALLQPGQGRRLLERAGLIKK
jgi:HlyD family secretion protein